MRSVPFFGWAMILLTAWTVTSPYMPSSSHTAGKYDDGDLPQEEQKPNAINPKLEDMIGQMLVVGFTGTSPRQDHPKVVAQQLSSGQISGVLFMNWNVRSRAQVKKLTQFFANASPTLPPLISVDQEGGAVQRLSRRKGFRRYPSAKVVARRMGPDEALLLYRKMAQELKDSGFNLNFGPVVDLDTQRRNPIIGRQRRSYGADAGAVSAYAKAFITAHREVGVLTSLKHFPGHGSSRTDSHRQLVDLSKSWEPGEMGPYKALLKDDFVDTVMVGHLYHPDISGPVKTPASLSPSAIQTILRKDIGFKGVVITDDLEMGAIVKNHTLAESLILAINAGNDILLLSNRRKRSKDLPIQAINIIKDAVQAGRIERSRIRQAYDRISAMKKAVKKLAIKAPETNVESARNSFTD